MSKKNVNVKKKPDPPERPSKERDEAYFKVLTDWLASNGGSFEGMGSDQIKWYRANYPKYAPTQSATGNQTAEIKPDWWTPTGGKDPEFDKRYEEEQRRLAAFIKSDHFRNSLPIGKEAFDVAGLEYHEQEKERKRKLAAKAVKDANFPDRTNLLEDEMIDYEAVLPEYAAWKEEERRKSKAYTVRDYGFDSPRLEMLNWNSQDSIAIDSIARDKVIKDRRDNLYNEFTLRLGSKNLRDRFDSSNAYWNPGDNILSFDDKKPGIGTLREELAHRANIDVITPDTRDSEGRHTRGYYSSPSEDRALTKRNLSIFADNESSLPNHSIDYVKYMANNAERRAKQYVTRQSLAEYGFDPNGIIPSNAQDSLAKYYDKLPVNAQTYYDYYYKRDAEDINKFGLGGTIGSTVGAASNLALPGLGAVLTPILTGIGNKIDEKKMIKDSRNQQFSAIQETDNPYGYAMGGMMTDPPLQARGMAQESTGVKNIMTRPEGTYQKEMIPDSVSPMTSHMFTAIDGAQAATQYRADVRANQRAITAWNEKMTPYLGKFDTTAQDRHIRATGGRYGAGGMINRKYGIGGAMNGNLDFAKYQGNKHTQGGIGVDQKGQPTPNTVNEVEGNETRFMIDGQAYIFSDQLKF